MINFDFIEILINLKENENILKINNIFVWNIFKEWINFCIIIKNKFYNNLDNKIINI